MADIVRDLLTRIAELEDELAKAIDERQERLHYRLEGSKVRFEENLRRIHTELKTGIFRWLAKSELRNVISAPFVYMMIVPFLLLDAFLFLYQAICFPLYRIPKVRRGDYIVIDRQHLGYLNAIEKLNCTFCGYADGLLAYTRQVLSRTEMYWCPIKHARKVLDPHRRYARFADFGDGDDYPEYAAEMRRHVREEGADDSGSF